MFGGGIVTALEHLSGNVLNSHGIKWILENKKNFFRWWLISFVLLFIALSAFDYLSDWLKTPAHSRDTFKWDAKTGTASAMANLLWLHFWALVIVPAYFVVIGLVMWALITAGLTFVLLAFGPFILMGSARPVFFHYAARALANADKREQEEKAVMAALGWGGTARRRPTGQAQIMPDSEFRDFYRNHLDKYEVKNPVVVGKHPTVANNAGGLVFITVEKHVLVIAGTRAGKGRDVIIPNLKISKGSAFVLDPKGENYQKTHLHRQQHGPTFALDPFSVSGAESARFNPLRYLSGDSTITDAQTLADALIVGSDYFSSSAAQLVFGLILYVSATPNLKTPEGETLSRDLVTVRRLLMRDLSSTTQAMIENKAENAAVRQVIADVGEWALSTNEKEFSSIRNSAVEQTKWLNSPEMCRVLEEGDGSGHIDFSDYLKGVMSVYVCLPAPYFATFNRWLRLVVASALDTMTKRLNPPDLPVRFILDEIAQIGNLSKIESALTLSAGYGVQLCGIWQHIADIQRCYPSSGIGGWVSSSGIRLLFGVQDNETIQYFAKASGDALTETAIRQLSNNELICMIDGQNPILLNRTVGPDGSLQPKSQPETEQAEAGA